MEDFAVELTVFMVLRVGFDGPMKMTEKVVRIVKKIVGEWMPVLPLALTGSHRYSTNKGFS
ncbi:hypothetical protein [Thioalkalivibrio sp. HK1]|uniref:hypothetical protein n=1 Tax=Thioalkalivibrio sp. HK1 TaxID=1469245 RepID=UPI001E469A25|nr:hypothetical protein [Thioalkalivibrio sp. HK1]